MLDHHPPKYFQRFFRWFCHADYHEELAGDIEEIFYDTIETEGLSAAKKAYRKEILKLFRPSVIREIPWPFSNQITPAMSKNFLKISLRHFGKNLSFSLVNLFGLAFGLAAALSVLFFIQDEVTYEHFHSKADRIVRVNTVDIEDADELKMGATPNKAAFYIKETFPEVEETTRVFPHNFGQTASINYKTNNFVEDRLYWADSTIFNLFDFQFLKGDIHTALDQTKTVILSETTAKRYFGNRNPIGEMLKVDNAIDVKVTGVFKDLPTNTHLPFHVIGSFSGHWFSRPDNQTWSNASFFSYLLLKEGSDKAAVEAKLQTAIKKVIPADNLWYTFELQGLKDIHLFSRGIEDEFGARDVSQIYILSGLAILLLLIACINYMNLATAKSQKRAKEVGVNKTLGASSGQMATQFFIETGLLAFGGVILSLVILYLFLPYFNQLADKNLSFALLAQPKFYLGLVGMWVLITLLAGSYPALYLSSFSPMNALRTDQANGFNANSLRKGLVVFQFSIATVLIISTLFFYLQLNFIKNKKLGFEPEQVLAVRIQGIRSNATKRALEKELQQLPAVLKTSLTQTFPSRTGSGRTIYKINAPDENGKNLTTCRADPNILNVLGVKLIAGRPLKQAEEQDTIFQVILNESAIKYLGISPEESIGKRVNANLGISEIVGVCEDFHAGSMHQQIGNYAFHNKPTEWLSYMLVKINTNDLSNTIQQLQDIYTEVAPTAAFEYTFLDESMNRLYAKEEQLAKVVFLFAGLTIFIACLGLFALAAYATERRTKEIGIRKVLGASVGNIVGLLSKEFLQLVGISFLIAIPIAWVAMQRWLQDFAYRVEMEWWVFAIAGILAIFIAFITVSFQSLKAALSNPVEAIKLD